MTIDEIPEEVRQFIAGRITSVMQLEVLLFLAAQANQTWTVGALVKHFRVDPEWVDEEIGELCKQGLLQSNEPSGSGEPAYRYSPSTPELERVVSRLAKVYADRRVSVTTLIYSKPVDNIRVFADAFRFRKG